MSPGQEMAGSPTGAMIKASNKTEIILVMVFVPLLTGKFSAYVTRAEDSREVVTRL